MRKRTIILALAIVQVLSIWEETELTRAREGIASVAGGRYAYFAGGEEWGNIVTSTVDVYDLYKDEWANTTSLGSARYDIRATNSWKYCIFAGGKNSSDDVSDVDIYNTDMGDWENTASLSFPREGIAAAALGNYSFFAGGFAGSLLNVVEIFNAATLSWEAHQYLSVARSYAAAVGAVDLVLFAGGYLSPGVESNVVDIFDISSMSFLTSSSLSVARERACAAASGNLIFIAGGLNNIGRTEVDIYNVVSRTWLTPAALSEGRYGMTCASTSEYVLFAAGYGTRWSSTVDIYISSQGKWGAMSLKKFGEGMTGLGVDYGAFSRAFVGGPNKDLEIFSLESSAYKLYEPRYALTAESVIVGSNNVVLIAGGMRWNMTATVDIFDVHTNKTTLDFLSVARAYVASGTAGDLILFAGGNEDAYGDVIYFDTVDIFNASSMSWATPTTLSAKRGYLAGGSAGGMVLFAGGKNSEGTSDIVDIYDHNTMSWSVDSLSEPRYDISAASAGDSMIFFAGGCESYSKCYDTVDIFYTSSKTWGSANLYLARSRMGAESSGDYVVFAGGTTTWGNCDMVDIYKISSEHWSWTVLSSERRSPATAATSDGRIIFAGGFGSSEGYYSNVIDIFDTTNEEWYVSAMAVGRVELAAFANGKDVFIVGGRVEFDFSNSIEVFNSTGSPRSIGCLLTRALTVTILGMKLYKIRAFRDDIMAKYVIGRSFIRVYYALSPYVVSLMERSAVVNYGVRFILYIPLRLIL